MKKLLLFILFTAACAAGCDGKKPSAPAASGGVNSPAKTSDPKVTDKKSPSDPVVSQPATAKQDTRKYRKMKDLEDAGIFQKLDRTDTLGGIDANSDGIRDDIERFIEEQKITDKQKSALRFHAYALQKTLFVDLNDKAALRKLDNEDSRSLNCLHRVFPNEFDRVTRYTRLLEAYTMNTRSRTRQYINFNRAMSGSVLSLSKGDTCEIH